MILRWDYAYLGECGACSMIDKRLYRPRFPADDKRRVIQFPPICMKCREAYEAEHPEEFDGSQG